MNDQERPQDLTVNRQEETLEIVWADGHRSIYPLAGIRNVCPCAECRGGHEAMSQPVERAALFERPDRTWQLSSAFLVGHYALGIERAEGHDGGIYTWTFLRDLCPCDEREAARAGAPEVSSA